MKPPSHAEELRRVHAEGPHPAREGGASVKRRSPEQAELHRLEAEILTKKQRDFLRAETSPRWDLDPPQREEFPSDRAYFVELAAYVDRCLA